MTIRKLYTAFAFAGSLIAQTSPAVINVDVGKPAKEIPRTLFGTFLEPLGNSIYNGLWAQLLENPSFEADLWSAGVIRTKLQQRPELERSSNLGLPVPWEPLKPLQGNRYEARWRDAANSERSLLIMALPSGETGIRQLVYPPAQRCLQYRGSLFVKPVSGNAELSVSFRRRDRPDEMLSQATFTVSGTAWVKHEFQLSLPAGLVKHLEPIDFVISLSNAARILVDQAALTPADAIDGFDPEIVKLAQDMHTPLVRYGGNFTSSYHWRDGIGPPEQRWTMLNQAWQMPEYNQFGTDEFLRFCNLIHAQPQIALNLGSGTPEEAADWVKYVDSKWGDRRGGLLWELGNELWGNFQIGYPTLSEIAGRTNDFSRAVRAVDPQARLIGTGADCDQYDPWHVSNWNAAQLKDAPGAYSYLSTHFVVGSDVLTANATAEFKADASFALPIGIEQRLALMRKHFDADPAAQGKVRIAFTEWLFVGEGQRAPNYTNMGGAVDVGGFLNMLMRNSDFVPVSDMSGLMWFAGIWKKKNQVYAAPSYWVFRLYANADVARTVTSKTEVATYDVHGGVNRIPEITGVPYLDVVAAVNTAGDKLTLFCVNRKRDGDIRAAVRVEGFAAPMAARAQQLSASDIYAVNNESTPNAVTPKERMVTLDSVVFPPASVTVIEIPRR